MLNCAYTQEEIYIQHSEKDEKVQYEGSSLFKILLLGDLGVGFFIFY
jgi:hypothetical protein